MHVSAIESSSVLYMPGVFKQSKQSKVSGIDFQDIMDQSVGISNQYTTFARLNVHMPFFEF